MDLKAAKNMKIREMACNDVQKVADSLNVNLTVSMLYVHKLIFPKKQIKIQQI